MPKTNNSRKYTGPKISARKYMGKYKRPIVAGDTVEVMAGPLQGRIGKVVQVDERDGKDGKKVMFEGGGLVYANYCRKVA